jgi:DNA invertase Pin-like site-specific DNA recombinase
MKTIMRSNIYLPMAALILAAAQNLVPFKGALQGNDKDGAFNPPHTTGRYQRLNALMRDARRGAFDVVVVWRFDRFARSIEQLVLALAEFRTLGIDFVSSQEALDTSTPMGRAMFTIIGAMAELERNVIRERVVAGMEHARNHGTKSGASIGRPRAVFDRARVIELRDAGQSWRQIASALSVGVATVCRVYDQGVLKPSSKETQNRDAIKRVAGV